MKVFYHHVGSVGAREDFKKTVFKAIPITFIKESIPDGDPYKQDIISTLVTKFPKGEINCWGVPAGASFVIKNLEVGDCVLLVESARIDGGIPALCQVVAYWNHELRPLSEALWGNEKFPYIFFFITEKIDYSWIQFLHDIGYKENFNPRGQFYSISESKLRDFGGGVNYIEYLRLNYRKTVLFNSVINLVDEMRESNATYIIDVDRELNQILKRLEQEPKLKEEQNLQLVQQNVRPRDAAFSIAVKKLYDNKCAFCGKGLKSRDGYSEVQSAHIYPKKLDGSDDVRNGICLCRFHHWAFDAGWIAISDDYHIIVHKDIPREDDYVEIIRMDGQPIRLPSDIQYAPHILFLKEQRKMAGFD